MVWLLKTFNKKIKKKKKKFAKGISKMLTGFFCAVFLILLPTVALALDPAPTISAITPTSGPTAGGTSVKIEGANFAVSDFGNGHDGAVNISANKNINTNAIATGRTCADAINYSVVALSPSGATLDVSPAADCLLAGDEVLLINLQGTSTNNGNVGNFESLYVAAVDGSNITFATNKTKYYGDGVGDDLNIGIASTNQRVMLQRVPNYTDVTIDGGFTLTANTWDGIKGGVLFFRAKGTLTNNGIIDMNAKGFPGGAGDTGNPATCTFKKKGDSYGGSGGSGQAGNLGGGGGAAKKTSIYGGGGGGASYGTTGNNGSAGDACGGGLTGALYGSQELSKLFLGSGGGANGYNVDGGAGGGAVYVIANAINVNSAVRANGANGVNGSNYGGGGGGSGGSVLLKGNTVALGSSVVTASGGAGGTITTGPGGPGGAGGVGRVAVYYGNTVSGTANPVAYQQQNSFVNNSLTLSLGGTNFSKFGVASSSVIVATSPTHTAGVVDTVVTNSDGQSATLAGSYTYIAPPSISAITPSSAIKNGGDAVTVTGNNFYGTPNVTFGGTAAISVTLINATTLSVVVPAHEVGIYDVVVTNPDGQIATLAGGFTYNELAPTVSSITPDFGSVTGGTNVTVTGTDFVPQNTGGSVGWATVAGKNLPSGMRYGSYAVVGDYIYIFGGNNGTSYVNVIYRAPISDPTTWENTGKTLPITLGLSQVAVVGEYVYLFGGYNSAAKNIIYRAPVSDPTTWTDTGKTLPANLYGSHFAKIGDYLYLFGGHNGSVAVNVIYRATVADPTTWSVVAGKTLPAAFNYARLAVIGDNVYLFGGLNGATEKNTIYQASVADPTTWTDTGKTLPTNLYTSQSVVIGDYIYLLGGHNGSGFTSTIYRAPITDPTTWTNVGDTLAAGSGFSGSAVIDNYVYLFGGNAGISTIYRAPVVQFRPNTYNPAWQTNWQTIAVDQSAVIIGGTAATNVNFIDATTITATTSAHAGGVVDVTVTNYDGQSANLAEAYSYMATPTITSITPGNALVTGGDTVTISGTNFFGIPIVNFGSTAATGVTLVNSTTLTATVPANFAGTYDVVVINPDGQIATLIDGFTYNELAPTISSISPDFGPAVGSTNVTITGTNFVPQNTGGDTWSNVVGKTMPASLYLASSAVIGDYVYYFGGTPNGTSAVNTIYRAPISDPTTWSNTGSVLPSNLFGSSLAIVGDYIYMFGGFNGSATVNTIYRAPVSDPTSWSNVVGKTLPGVLRSSQLVIIGDYIYLFGGSGSKVIYSAPVSDPTTWTNTGSTLPVNIAFAAVATAGGNIYLMGGYNGTAYFSAIYSAPLANPTNWTNTGKTTPDVFGARGFFTIGDYVYYVGGYSGGTTTTNKIYSAPISDPTTWTNTGKTLPGNFSLSDTVVIDGYAYLFGGYGGAAKNTIYRASVQHFRPNILNYAWQTNWQMIATDQSSVTFGGISATNVNFVNPTTITATAPAHAGGSVDVTVTNYDGQSATLTNGFGYTATPTLASVTPATSLITGGDTVTISGSNFFGTPTVTFGGTAATGVTLVNATTLTATVPAHLAGTYDVVVTNPDAQAATLADVFTYNEPAPAVSNITPTVGPAVGGTSVTITGSSFVPQNSGGDSGWATVAGKTLPSNLYSAQQAVIGDKIYLFGGVSATSVYANTIFSAPVSDPTTWTNTGKTLPVTLGYSQLAVVGNNLYLFGGYNGSATNVIYSAPVSDPTTWTNTGKTLPSNLYGSQLAVVGNSLYLFGGHNGSAYTNVIYSAPISDPTTWINTSKTLPSNLYGSNLAAIGDYLYLFGGLITSTYTNIVYFAPVSDPTTWTNTGKTLPAALGYSQLAVVGNNLYLFGGYSTASLNSIYTASVSDPTTWTNTGKTLPATLGYSQFAVVDSNLYLFGGYTAAGTNAIYRAPLSHFRPNQYNKSWRTNWRTIATDQSSVTLGGTAAIDVSFVNPTTVTATTPAHAGGAVDVTVTNYDGQSANLAGSYSYMAAPTVTSVTPNNALITGGDTVTISGTNFFGAPTVTFGSTAATNVTLVNATTLTATVPAHEAGTYDVVVTNPDAQAATLTDGFTYNEPAPVISNIAPTVGPAVGGTSVTITGTNFMPQNTGGGAGWATVVDKTLPAGLYSSQQAVIGDEVYLFGGYSSNVIYSAPVSDPTTWINTGKTLPSILSSSQLAVVGDYVYLFGGYNGAATNVIYSAPISDPTTWTNTGKTLPGNLYASQLAIVGSTIYLFGGYGSNVIYSAPISDPTTWTNTGATLPSNLGHSRLAVIDNNIYLFGGYIAAYSNVIYSASVSDPTTWTMVSGKTLPAALGNAQLMIVGDNIYLLGGYNGGILGKNVIYSASVSDPTTWTNGGNTLSANLGYSQISIIGNYAYLFGGHNGSAATSAIYRAPIQHFRPNQYNSSWKTDWYTNANLNDQANVAFGGVNATSIDITNPTTITATTPAHAGGAVDVTVTNYDGQSATLAGGFTYTGAPTVTSITPQNPTNNQSVTGISISGENFQNGATVKFAKAGESDIACTNVVFSSVTNLTCDADFHGVVPGVWDVVVTNPDAQIATLTSGLDIQGEITQIRFVSGAQTILPGNVSSMIRVRLEDSAQRATNTENPVTVNLATASGTGEFSLSATSWVPATTLSFAAGENVKTVYYKDATEGTFALSASENPSLGWNDGSQNIIISKDAPYTWPFETAADYSFDGAKVSVQDSLTSTLDKTAAQTVGNVSTASFQYSQLTSFTEQLGPDNQGSVKYQLSHDEGVTWYWWNGSAWAVATQGVTQANDAATLNAHIGTFHSATSQIGVAELSFRAYLVSDGTQRVDLDSVLVGYELYPYRYAFIATPASLSEGEVGTFTVQAQDQLGNAMNVVADTTLPLTTSTPLSGKFALDLNEDITTRWDHLSVMIPAGQSSATFYYQDSAKGTKTLTAGPASGEGSIAATTTQQVKSRYRFRVMGVTDPIDMGMPSSVTVQAVDYLGSPANDYVGTVHFTSNEPAADLPGNFTFASGMFGNHTFVNGVSLMSQGEYCVTVTDVADADVAGSQCAITVGPPRLGSPDKLRIITAPQYIPVGTVSSAITIQLQDVANNPAARLAETAVYISQTSGTGQLSLNGTTGWTSGTLSTVIPANKTSVNVYFKDTTIGTYALAVRDEAVLGTDVAFTNDSQQIAAVAGPPASFVFDNFPDAVVNEIAGPVKVKLHDSMDNVVSTFNDQAVYLASSNGGLLSFNGVDGWDTQIDKTLLAGTSEFDVYYRQTSLGADTIRVSDAVSFDGAVGIDDDSAVVDIVADTPVQFVLLGAPASLITGQTSTQVTVEAHDQYGNVAPVAANTPVYLYSNDGATVFAAGGGAFDAVDHVTIPAGSAAINFRFKQTAHVAGIDITASDNASAPDGITGIVDADAAVTIEQGAIASLAISNISPMIVGSEQESAKVTVESFNQFGVKTAMSNDTTLFFHSDSGASHEFSLALSPSWAAITQATWSAGQDKLDFYYKDAGSGNVIITAGDDAAAGVDNGIANAHLDVALTTSLAALKISSAPINAEAGQLAGPIRVELRDSLNNVAIAPVDVSVALTNDDSSAGFMNASGDMISAVVIPAGTSNAVFYYKVLTPQTRTMFVSVAGLAGDSQNIVFDWGIPSKLVFTGAPGGSVAGQVVGPFGLQLRNAHNVAIPASENIAISLGSNHAAGKFDSSAGGTFDGTFSSLQINAGNSSAQFYYRDTKAGVATLDIASVGLAGDSTDVAVVPAQPVSLVWIAKPTSIVKTTGTGTFALETRDEFANESPMAGNLPIALASSGTQGEFSLLTSPWSGISSLTLAAGQSRKTFYYKDQTAGVQEITLSSSLNNLTHEVAVTDVPVGNNLPTKLLFQGAAQSLLLNQEGTFSFYLADSANDYAKAIDTVSVTVSSSSVGGEFYDPTDATWKSSLDIAFATDETMKSFRYRDNQTGTPTLTVSSAGLTSANQQELVRNELTAKIALTANANIRTTDRIPVTIELRTASDVATNEPSQTTVALTSTDANGKFYNGAGNQVASINIPAWSSQATVYFQQTVPGTAELRATENPTQGWTQGTQNVTVVAEGTHLRFTTSAQNKEAGIQSAAMRAQLQDVYGNPVLAASDTALHLSTASSFGEFSLRAAGDWSATNEVTMGTGSNEVEFYYKDTAAGTHVLTVSDVSAPAENPDTGLVNATQNFVSVAAEPHSIVPVAGEDQSLLAGQPSALVTVQLRDQFGNAKAVGENTRLYLAASSPTAKFSLSTDFAPARQIASVLVTAGSSTASFYFRDTAEGMVMVNVTSTAPVVADVSNWSIFNKVWAAPADLVGAVITMSVSLGSPARLLWESLPANQVAGESSTPIIVKLTNDYNVELPAADNTDLFFSSSSVTGEFALSSDGPWNSSVNTVLSAGSSRKTLYYRDTTVGSPLLTASDVSSPAEDPDTGLVNASGFLPIVYGEIAQLAFVTAPQTIVANHESAVMTIEARNEFGVPTPAATDTVIYLRSNSARASFSADSVVWGANGVLLRAGQERVNFYYRDPLSGAPTLTASDLLPVTPDTGWSNAVQTQTIEAQQVASLGVTNIADPQYQGSPSSLVVMALDGAGYVVEEYAGTLSSVKAYDNLGNEETAILPALPYTFDPTTDRGSRTFVNGVAFLSTGEKKIEVVDTEGIQGSQQNITVVAAPGSELARVRFIAPAEPLSVISSQKSDLITVQLQDTDGDVLNAAPGGFKVRLTSSGSKGKFSADDSTWEDDEIVLDVLAGTNFTSFYYKDSQADDVVLTATDWQSDADDGAIDNDTFAVTVVSDEADHLEILGSATQVAGTKQLISIAAHDADGNIATGYTGSKTLTFSGASAAPAGQVPTCKDAAEGKIAFGAATELEFVGGVATCELTLYNAENAEIETTDGVLGTAPATGNDLDVSVVPASTAATQSIVSGAPNPQLASAPVNVKLETKDAFGNTTREEALSVIFKVGGVNIAGPLVMTFNAANGFYEGSYVPTRGGDDQITVEIGGVKVSKDADGASDGIYQEKITGSGAEEEATCALVKLNSIKAAGIAFEICVEDGDKITSAQTSKGKDGETDVATLTIEAKKDQQVKGELTITSFDKKPSGLSVPETYDEMRYAFYKYLKIESDFEEENLKSGALKMRVARSWLVGNGVGKVFGIHIADDTVEIPAKWDKESADYMLYELESPSLDGYWVVAGNKTVLTKKGETEDKDKKTDDEEKELRPEIEPEIITTTNREGGEKAETAAVIADALERFLGGDAQQAQEFIEKAGAVSMAVAGAAALPMLPNMLGILRMFTSVPLRRRKKWGMVYDTENGEPIPHALVSIRDEEGRVREIKNADAHGTYFFLAREGVYTVEATKEGYMAMDRVQAASFRTYYDNSFDRSDRIVLEQDDVVSVNIPMQKADSSVVEKSLNKSVLLHAIFWTGFVVSIAAYLLDMTTYNALVVVFFLVNFLLTFYFSGSLKGSQVVSEQGLPIPFAMVKISVSENGQQVMRTATNEKGRFVAILDAGSYLLEVQAGEQKVQKEVHFGRRKELHGKITVT